MRGAWIVRVAFGLGLLVVVPVGQLRAETAPAATPSSEGAVSASTAEAVADVDREQRKRVEVRDRWHAISRLRTTDIDTALRLEKELTDELLAEYPRAEFTKTTLQSYLRRLAEADLAVLEERAKFFAASPEPWVRDEAANWLRILDLRVTPMELRFEAIDGREVDLAKLRGKVVVVEFTGVTWCPACRVAEVELKRLYDKYRSDGLEIVAITFEFSPNVRDKVLRLIRERELPWPFSFDGLAHASPIIARYGIRGYPTTFVLDRSGRLAAYDPKMDELEKAIVSALKPDRTTD